MDLSWTGFSFAVALQIVRQEPSDGAEAAFVVVLMAKSSGDVVDLLWGSFSGLVGINRLTGSYCDPREASF